MTDEDKYWITRHYRNGSPLSIIFQLYPALPKGEIIDLLRKNGAKISRKTYVDGKTLKAVRNACGLTVKDAARMIGHVQWPEARIAKAEIDDPTVADGARRQLLKLYGRISGKTGVDPMEILKQEINNPYGERREPMSSRDKDELEVMCAKIKALRVKAGVTQKELGKMLGVTKGVARQYEMRKTAKHGEMERIYDTMVQMFTEKGLI